MWRRKRLGWPILKTHLPLRECRFHHHPNSIYPFCPVIWIKTQCKPQKCHSLGTLSGHVVGRPAQNGEGDREKQEGVMQWQSSMLPSGTFLSKGPALTSSSATVHRNTGSHPSADRRATPGPCWAGRGRMRW